jgi:tRNA 2-thiouridine synthesizing protein B
MSTLHIVSCSPFCSDSLTRCLSLISEGDTMLFIENGVYIVNCPERLPPEISSFVLEEDLAARGLSAITLQTADYADFVRMVCKHDNSISWT